MYVIDLFMTTEQIGPRVFSHLALSSAHPLSSFGRGEIYLLLSWCLL